MIKLPPKAVDAFRKLIADFVDHNFEQMENDKRSGRLSANDLRKVLTRYKLTFVYPPNEEFENLDIVQVKSASIPTWSIDFDMWTKEDGKSDWTLSVTIVQEKNGEYKCEIDDFHVL